MKKEDKKQQSKVFLWALIVVVVNLVQYFFHNSVTIGIALIVTVFALYTITIKNRIDPHQMKNKNNK